jgi:cytochrome b
LAQCRRAKTGEVNIFRKGIGMDTKSVHSGNETVKVWDPVIRIGHWVLVAAFAIAYLTEGEPEWLHTWAGYTIAVVVIFRVFWGFVGSKNARFSEFITGPAAVIEYLRELTRGTSKRYLGHSPAGGAMTLALLAVLVFTTFSGMANLAAKEGEGPLAGLITRVSSEAAPRDSQTSESEEDEEDHENDGTEESIWEEVHEVSANLALVLIIIHLGGVTLASKVHRENLPRSMVSGRKRSL